MLAAIFLALLMQDAAPPTGEGRLPVREREILIELYNSTDGPHWKKHAGWLGPEGTECSWEGVECLPINSDSDRMHVTQLDLMDDGLRGSIPASISELPYLDQIYLHGNDDLAKPLPEALLKKWDAGEVDLRANTRLSDVTRIFFDHWDADCWSETALLGKDGSVLLHLYRCRNSQSQKNPKPYCEIKTGRTLNFDRLARFLEVQGFFQPLRSHHGGVWIDVPITRISATRAGATHFIQIGFNGSGSLAEWSFEQAIRGVLENTNWLSTKDAEKCPSIPEE
jgi:hypothetical protein